MRFEKKNLWGLILGVVVAGAGLFLFGVGARFYFSIAIGFILAFLPFIISLVLSQGKQREKEERFLEFTRDLVESVKSGTPVSKSILNLKGRDYGSLTEHIDKLANQVSIGITLTKALNTFARDTKSEVIARAVGLISEAERAGGKIDTIVESVSNSVNQIESLRKERKSSISNLVVQGYIIFLVFIVIMLVLQFKILPMTEGLADVQDLNVAKIQSIDAESFATPLLIMIIVQSLFAGLVIGKIAEGTIKAGIKHSFILVALALLITTGARALMG